MVASLRGIDAFLNCLPVVNTVNGLIQATCRSQWQASIPDPDAPEDSSFKRNFQILVLKKSAGDLFFDSLPLIGNIVALVKCVVGLIYGFEPDVNVACARNKGDNFPPPSNKKKEIGKSDKAEEIDGLDKAEEMLTNKDLSESLPLEVRLFQPILENRTWHIGQLLCALNQESFDKSKVNLIFDYWSVHQTRLNEDLKKNCKCSNDDGYDGGLYGKTIYKILGLFLNKSEPELFDRMLELLPNRSIPPEAMEGLLLVYSYPDQDNQAPVAALTEEQRKKLIQKSYLLSGRQLLQQLQDYYNSFVNFSHVTEEFLNAQFNALTSWIESAEVKALDVATFMTTFLRDASAVLTKTSAIQFIDGLLTHYENEMDDDTKKAILEAMPDTYASKAAWTAKWQVP